MTVDSGTLYWLPRILARTDLDATSTLILVGIADHIGGDDRCHVKIAKLATYGRCSYPTAKRRLAVLEEAGFLSRVQLRRDDGGKSVYRYRLMRDAFAETPSAQADPGGWDHQVSRGVGSPGSAEGWDHQGDPTEVPPMEPPPKEPTPTGEASLFVVPAVIDEVDQVGFEDMLWPSYPRRDGKRVGKQEAIKAWLRLPQTERERAIRNLAHYIDSGVRPMDCHRWLRPGHPGNYADWDEPAVPDRPKVGPSPRQQRKASAVGAFVGAEQPSGSVASAFFGRPPSEQKEITR